MPETILPPLPAIGACVRSACGQARATYRPDWSATSPWVTYVQGTAGRQFNGKAQALRYLGERHFKFPDPEPK